SYLHHIIMTLCCQPLLKKFSRGLFDSLEPAEVDAVPVATTGHLAMSAVETYKFAVLGLDLDALKMSACVHRVALIQSSHDPFVNFLAAVLLHVHASLSGDVYWPLSVTGSAGVHPTPRAGGGLVGHGLGLQETQLLEDNELRIAQ